ncbi:hypothetical protein GCM10007972_10050 [Iodidimonas muriae]|uniref:Peptidase M20 dimerisation domain-containing protein n=1 Tax=Iodidimonas muriae TaxID=261467 RepID=A0ABQ2LB06_9PROT|nr:hydrolase [Iodidimonas muriae]GER08056.1 hypothetical protein JCM17843_23660 [Kordiimonadales bacterium JCM 17843]GGO09006.1 hypothetical protein GCM10007972_10050 [Iodidimonas muriae]
MGLKSGLDMAPYQASLDWIDRQQKAMVRQVEAWSCVNSGSHNLPGLADMGAKVTEAFSALGGNFESIALPPSSHVTPSGDLEPLPLGPVYRFQKRPDAKRRVLLTGHLDTVFAKDSPFQVPRWLDDTLLNGPGVADMKGGLIVMLHALLAVERSGLADDLGWEVLISSDEEIGSIGSAAILTERAPHAHIGLTYEPALADGTLAGARKGSGNFSIVVRGRAAHAGRAFHEGRNAVVALAEVIAALDGLNGQREGVTVNPAVISGGAAPNIVPDMAVLRVNARVKTHEDARWVEQALEEIRTRISSREGYDLMVHGGFNRPPKPISGANQALFDVVARCGDALGLKVAYQATGGCCEGNNLAAAGLPNVDTLGVRGGKIHSSDEFVLVDSFAERAKLSAVIMLGFAQGHFDQALMQEGA